MNGMLLLVPPARRALDWSMNVRGRGIEGPDESREYAS
jgi:hypothetical protein